MNVTVLMKQTRDKARSATVAVIVSVVGILTSILIGVGAYNHRYDADAMATGAIKAEFRSNQNMAEGTLTFSAGKIRYGYFQKSGPTPTTYQMTYKETSKTSWASAKELTVYKNNDAYGEYDFSNKSITSKWDVLLYRTNNKGKSSSFQLDFGLRQ